MNDWTKDIQRLMSDHEVQAPDGLLDDIKAEMQRRNLTLGSSPGLTHSEMGTAKPAVKTSRIVSLWHYRWIAAAAAVAIIAVPVIWKLLPEAKDEIAKVQSVSRRSNNPQSNSYGTPSTNATLATTAEVHKDRPSDTLVALQPTETETTETVGNITNGSNVTNENVPANGSTTTKPDVIKHRPRYDENEGLLAYEKPHSTSSKGFSVSAYYGGSLVSGGTSGMSVMQVMAGSEPYGFYPLDMTAANSVGFLGNAKMKRKAHHKQPIKLGISAGYKFNNRWRANIGVTYSYLSSDFTMEGMPKETQKLHYVGIPVSIDYSIVKGHKIEIYAAVGGEIEKLVKGTKSYENFEDENVKEKRPQWSVKAAVGAAYHFTPAISVYAEPGVSYHFDNHSEVENVYKDSKTSFSLNLGIRILPNLMK